MKLPKKTYKKGIKKRKRNRHSFDPPKKQHILQPPKKLQKLGIKFVISSGIRAKIKKMPSKIRHQHHEKRKWIG